MRLETISTSKHKIKEKNSKPILKKETKPTENKFNRQQTKKTQKIVLIYKLEDDM